MHQYCNIVVDNGSVAVVNQKLFVQDDLEINRKRWLLSENLILKINSEADARFVMHILVGQTLHKLEFPILRILRSLGNITNIK